MPGVTPSAEKPALYLAPRRQITPLINGEFAPFYEWVGAGFYVAGSEQGAMFRDDRFLRTVRFGCDTHRLYLRFDLRRAGEFTIGIIFHQPAGLIVRTPAARRGTSGKVTVHAADGSKSETGEFAVERIVEVGIPFSKLGVTPGTVLEFQVKVFERGTACECYPENSPITLTVPAADSALAEWVV